MRNNRLIILKQIIAILCFFSCLLLSLLLAMHVGGKKYIPDFHFYLVIQLSLIAIAALAIAEKKNRYIHIDNIDRPAFLTCFFLTLYTLASDVLVEKPFRFAGISLFIILTIFALACRSNSHQDRIYKSFEIAVQLFLLVLMILTVLNMNIAIFGRLAGPVKNPSVFALYLGGIWAILLGSLESHLTHRSKKIVILLTIIEMAATLIMMLLSQSLTPLIAITIASLLWLFRLFTRSRGLTFALKILLSFGVLGVTILAILIILIRNLDVESGSRLLAKFKSASLSIFLSGRDYYWREYFRHMNLFGHGEKPYLWGEKINPHNALIGMMYMYGVPCVIPYILMFMMAIEKSYRYANRYTPYAAIPLYSIVTFVIMGIADNVEQPLVWLPTIACYLLMAPILLVPIEEIEKANIYETNLSEVQQNDL